MSHVMNRPATHVLYRIAVQASMEVRAPYSLGYLDAYRLILEQWRECHPESPLANP